MKRNIRKNKSSGGAFDGATDGTNRSNLRLLCFIYIVIISYPAISGKNDTVSDAVSDAVNEVVNDAIRQYPVINYNSCIDSQEVILYLTLRI